MLFLVCLCRGRFDPHPPAEETHQPLEWFSLDLNGRDLWATGVVLETPFSLKKPGGPIEVYDPHLNPMWTRPSLISSTE